MQIKGFYKLPSDSFINSSYSHPCINQKLYVMNVLYFANCESPDDVEETYKKLYQMFGLNGQVLDHWLRKAIDEEYENIKKALKEQGNWGEENWDV